MIELVFITSNREKLNHARYLCKDYDIVISKQKQYGIGYEEPRYKDKMRLLDESYKDAYSRWKKNISNPDEKFFFIEDTSVIINCLSKDKNDFPGTDIKYWMQNTNFIKIDEILKQNGNDRSVVVKSDILLSLNKNLRSKYCKEYLLFSSELQGVITEKEHTVETHPYYSWLSDKTFNKWFIPYGCDVPVTLLPIDVIDKYDFRAGAFLKMLNFLENEKIIKRKKEKTLNINEPLFPFLLPLMVICGPTCAGKTTIANFLTERYKFYHFEASDFMYQSYYEIHGVGSRITIGDFAENALKDNPCIVANKINKKIGDLKYLPIVISGFRSYQEIECFKKNFLYKHNINEYYIEANIKTRFERNNIRKRKNRDISFLDFELVDKQQYRMGLDEIKNKLSDNIIVNENSFDKYYTDFVNKAKLKSENINNPYSYIKKNLLESRLEDLIILSLLDSFGDNKYYTTAEITKLINKKFKDKKKSKDNVSRYFNQYFHPYYKIIIESDKRKYTLSNTGYSQALYLKNIYNI